MRRAVRLMLLCIVVPTGASASALSCTGPPTVDEVLAGATPLGPLTDAWALVRVADVEATPSGADIAAEVEATLRAPTPASRSILIVSQRDPMGTSVPMESASEGDLWLVPLRRRPDASTIQIGVCDGAIAVDATQAEMVRASGDIAGGVSEDDRSATKPGDPRQSNRALVASLVAVGAIGSALIAVVTVQGKRRG